MSKAIFAPGWVHEVLDVSEFEANNRLFWSRIAPYCEYNPPIMQSGFATKFSLGVKPAHPSIKGANHVTQHPTPPVVSSYWYHLSTQELMLYLPSDNLTIQQNTSAENSLCVKGDLSRINIVPTKVMPMPLMVELFRFYISSTRNGITMRIPIKRSLIYEEGSIVKVQTIKQQVWCLNTNIVPLMLEVSDENLSYSVDYGFEIQTFTSNDLKVVLISNEEEFVATSLSIKQTNSEQNFSFIEIKPGLIETPLAPQPGKVPPLRGEIGLVDLHWSHDTDKSQFKFSGTLLFDEISANMSSAHIYYSVHQDIGKHDSLVTSPISKHSTNTARKPPNDDTYLGRSYAKGYRVHELLLPNPQYKGDCYVIFRVDFRDAADQTIGESKLKVVYLENLR